jgi:hypothetical protein
VLRSRRESDSTRDRLAEFSSVEAVAVFLISLLVAAIVFAYLSDRLGFTIAPMPILVIGLSAAMAYSLGVRSRLSAPTAIGAENRALTTTVFIVLVLATFGWLLWMARPYFLPLGGESDLTHHLQLVDYIEQRWRLPHDLAAFTQIGNMSNYTPGSHLLAALAGAWTRTDGLHMVHPLLALTVALKAGLIFLIVIRLLPVDVPRLPIAVTSVLLLLLPYDYVIGSFARYSFYAQVIAELFAVAMWWALTIWDARPSPAAALLFGVTGMATFLSWPVWIGPPALALTALMLLRTDVRLSARLRDVALALGPIAIVGLLHALGRIAAFGIAGTGGAVFKPTLARLGAAFLVLSLTGLVLALRSARYRTTTLLLAAIGLQTVCLIVVARASHADSPYLAIKMIHLALYPLAACAALTLASVWQALWRIERIHAMPWIARRQTLVAWAMVAIVGVTLTRGLAAHRLPPPTITQDLFLAGRWARAHVPVNCVEYFVPNDSTAYWLQYSVLGNAMIQPGVPLPVLVFRDNVERWIARTAHPFAIADLAVLPRDVRDEIEVLAKFGEIVVGKRRGATGCTGD